MNLKQKKANPNSKYWKKKADDEWSKQIRLVGYCEVCAKTGKLDAHHIITRTRLRFRHDLSNGVCLCSGCHRFNAAISPHIDSFSAENFIAWLKVSCPGVYKWYEGHKDDKRQPKKTYRQCYEELKGE